MSERQAARSDETEPAAAAVVVELAGVTKRFPGVLAVDSVDLELRAGEVHAVAGENGAGKSTLMKLLSQVERPDEGHIKVNGAEVVFHGPRTAQALGIAMVHQEFALAPHLSVAENLFLGREPGRGGLVSRRAELRDARALLRRVGLDVSPARLAGNLTVAQQQLVEIAKALAVDARVVIMDEPSATLTEREIDELFEVIRSLVDDGIAVLYISHRLDEIFRIADRVTVMRDGRVVSTMPTAELDHDRLVRLMVGRDIANLYPRPDLTPGDVVLRVRGISRGDELHDCSFDVRAGEILGFAGLVGAGRTELARAVFGADPVDAGSVELDGRPLSIRGPRGAIESGIGYLSEDRKRDGLALELGVDQNITLARLPTRAGFLDLAAERRIAERRRAQLTIRTPSLRRRAQFLSGGNQQKVVGAKAEIFELMGELARDGKGIVLISSYLPELLNLCDRILVMHEGRIAGEVGRDEFSEERVIALATGAATGGGGSGGSGDPGGASESGVDGGTHDRG